MVITLKEVKGQGWRRRHLVAPLLFSTIADAVLADTDSKFGDEQMSTSCGSMTPLGRCPGSYLKAKFLRNQRRLLACQHDQRDREWAIYAAMCRKLLLENPGRFIRTNNLSDLQICSLAIVDFPTGLLRNEQGLVDVCTTCIFSYCMDGLNKVIWWLTGLHMSRSARR